MAKWEHANEVRWGDGNNFSMSPEIRSFLDGLILGDGHYAKPSNLSAYFRLNQKATHRDWVESIGRTFNQSGIKNSIKEIPAQVRQTSAGVLINASESVYISTPNYRNLLDERKRWYSDGRKRIPTDLSIENPITLAHWYMGDGNFYINKNSSKSITARLHTNGFLEEEVDKLKSQFNECLGLHVTTNHWRGQPILTFQNKNAASFLDIVRPFLVPSFSYKAPEDCWKPAQCIKCGIDLIGKPRSAKYCNGHLRATRTEAHRRWINANRDHIREYWRTRRKA